MPLYMWITIIRLLLRFCKQLWEYMLLRKHEGITFTPANIHTLLILWRITKQNPSLNRQLRIILAQMREGYDYWFLLRCLFSSRNDELLRGPMHMASSFRTWFHTLYIIRWTSGNTVRVTFHTQIKRKKENAAFFIFALVSYKLSTFPH